VDSALGASGYKKLLSSTAGLLVTQLHTRSSRFPDKLVQLWYKPAVPWLRSGYAHCKAVVQL